MQRHTKIFIIFSLLLFAVICGKFYKEYNGVKHLKNMIIKEEAKSLSALLVAFRQTYQDAFVCHNINIDEKTINLLPVKTTRDIAEKFSKILSNKTLIKTVSDRPRNFKNKANSFEMKVIDYFNKNKKENFYFKPLGNAVFYYAQPLYIKKSCLKCHGKRESAMPAVRNNYTKAYDYKFGELRGILSIKISKENIIKKLNNKYYDDIKIAFLIYTLFLLAIYLMVKIIIKNQNEYANTLEEKVEKQISELKEKEEILHQQSKMAAMGEMLENIAHQWRQPLSVISTAATGIIAQKNFGLLDEKKEIESLNSINNASQYLSETINDFRNFFKPNKEKILFSTEDVHKKVLKLFSSKFKTLNIEIIENIQNIEITGLNNELSQVIINLLSNAYDVLELKKNDKKMIFIDIYKNKNNVIIKIKDNGGGIPSDIMQKIFEPYFTTKHQKQGTGIGLYMSMEMITKHMNGKLEVKNKNYKYNGILYKGAEFMIILPLS